MAKEVLRRAGVPVPDGRLCRTPDEAAAAAAELGPIAVKAQVLVGGRGRAGGIRIAETPEEARGAAAAILGMDLKGHRVETVYCEQRLEIDRELYLAITIDHSARRPLLIASADGGVAIEEVPEKAIIRRMIDLPWGLQPFMARQVALRLGLPAEAHAAPRAALVLSAGNPLQGNDADCGSRATLPRSTSSASRSNSSARSATRRAGSGINSRSAMTPY